MISMQQENPESNWLLNSPQYLLALIMLVAVVLRLAYSLGVARGLLEIRPELESTDAYNRLAVNLLHGQGYRFDQHGPLATERAPAYPLFLLGVFYVAGVNYIAVQIAQALLGMLSCWLLFLLGRWVLSAELGLAAAALFAVYPNAVLYAARLYAENVYFPLFLAFAYFLCRASYEGSLGRGLAAGIAWGAGLLTRGTLLPLPFLLPFGLMLSRTHRSPRSRWLRWGSAAALAGVLMVAPWAARNFAVTGAFVPVSTWGWAPMYHGTQVAKRMTEWVDLEGVDTAATRHVGNEYAARRPNASAVAGRDAAGVHPAVRYDNFAREMVLEDWSSDPPGLLKRSVLGLGFCWFFTFGANLRLVSLIVHLPLLSGFVFGVVLMARRHSEGFVRAWPALGLIVFVNGFYAIAYPHVRYMSPAICLSFLFSALPLLLIGRWLWQRLPQRRLISQRRAL
jgi:4-amino-4-deoxy-L-arabinose transferase-like glycosyltransferase